jgi:hypothetical protein
MPLNKFDPKYQGIPTKSLKTQTQKFLQLMNALKEKEISESVVSLINEEVEKVNRVESKKLLTAQLAKSYQNILKISEKELNLVAQNHYRNMWLALGMTVFGLPFGVVFSSILSNYAFIGIGLPIGMGIGIAIGTKKDKDALDEGRQLNLQI